jgi:hypothetical protein
VIVKHTNPCGVATRDDLLEAYRLAVIADPVSAFGGIVAFNRPVDEKLARELREYRWGLRFCYRTTIGLGVLGFYNARLLWWPYTYLPGVETLA